MSRLAFGLILGLIGFIVVTLFRERIEARLAAQIYAFGLLVTFLGLLLNDWSVGVMLQSPYFASVIGSCVAFGTGAFVTIGIRRIRKNE